MDESTNLRLPDESSNKKQGFLTLPFDESQFKDFIVNLLGVQQRIDRTIKGIFVIGLDEILSINSLINQRVEQQNSGKLIQLQSQIYYDDGSSITLNSLLELETYNEVRPLISIAIRLTWSFLIQFPGKNTPEQQTIVLFINSYDKYYSSIDIQIEHTARSWGYDIDILLQQQIESLIIERSSIEKISFKQREEISNGLSIIYICASLLGIIYHLRTYDDEKYKFLESEVEKANTIDKKLDVLLSFNLDEYASLTTFWYLLLFFVVTMLFGRVVKNVTYNFLSRLRSSFLILTKKTKDSLDLYEKKAANGKLNIFLTVLMSILTGVISNYIFSYLI
jgi:hypothetical protein